MISKGKASVLRACFSLTPHNIAALLPIVAYVIIAVILLLHILIIR